SSCGSSPSSRPARRRSSATSSPRLASSGRRAMAEILFAEYPDPQGLARAIAALREAGHVKLDAFSPYGDEEVRKALGRPRSRLPVAICLVGLVAAGFTYFLQWFLVAYLYPLDVGGRPAHMP